MQTAVAALAAGGMVVVVDDEDRENEGDLVVAAELCTPEQMAFVVRHTTGIVCAPMPAARAAALQLPLMVTDNTDAHGTAFTVTVDHRRHLHRGVGGRPGHHRARPRRRRDAGPASSVVPGTCSRSSPARAGCWCGPGTPRPPST